MRRKRISSGRFSDFRSGVIASVMIRKRRVQSPVKCCRNSTGLAVSWPFNARNPRKTKGSRPRVNTSTLAHLVRRNVRSVAITLVIFLQIHAAIHASHLIAVSIEQQRFALEYLTQAALRSLAPARMIHVGIHVGIETILVGSRAIPSGGRLTFGEANFYDGLDALVAVLPGNDDADRRAILIGQRLSIHADAQQRKRIHSFVEA